MVAATTSMASCMLLLALLPAFSFAFAPIMTPLAAGRAVVSSKNPVPASSTYTYTNSARRTVQGPLFGLRATADPVGTVEYDEVKNNLVSVRYTPPPGMFKDGAILKYLGSCNGWDGETNPIETKEMTAGADGVYGVTVKVPDFALDLDFLITDGVTYDTNNGEFFHVPIVAGEEAQKAVYESQGILMKFFLDGALLGTTLGLPMERLIVAALRANVDLGTEDPMLFTETFKSKVPKDSATIPVPRKAVNRGMNFASQVSSTSLVSNAPISGKLEQLMMSSPMAGSGSNTAKNRVEYSVLVGKQVVVRATNNDLVTEKRVLGRYL